MSDQMLQESPKAPPLKLDPPELHADAYHGPVGRIVRLIERETEAHPAGILACLLVFCGVYVGRSPYQFIDGSRHGTNEMALLAGPSGDGRKGTATRWAETIFEIIDATFAAVNVVGGISSGPGIIFRVRDATPAVGEAKADEGIADKRLVIVQDETASALKQMSGRENTLEFILRQAADGVPLATMTRKDPLRSTGHTIGFIGAITPDEFRDLTSATAFSGGTVNRLLIIYVERVRSLPRGGTVDMDALQRLAEQLGAHLRRAQSFGELTLNADAWDVWDAEYERLTTGRPGKFGQATRRAAPHVRRLAAIYAVTHGRSIIEPADLRAALAVWQYAEDSAAYVLAARDFSANALKIMTALDAHPAGLSRTEMYDVLGSNAPDLDAPLTELRNAGAARPSKRKTAGRPAEVWQAARHYFASTSHSLAGEKGRRGEGPAEGGISPFPLSPGEKTETYACSECHKEYGHAFPQGLCAACRLKRTPASAA